MAALSTTALVALSVAKTVNQFARERQAANTAEAEGQYARQVSDLNAALLDQQATDALARGVEAEGRYRREVKQIQGAQRVALANQGVALDSGSALDIQTETAELGELDALTIRNNAAREAWGFEAQAAITRHQGLLAATAGKNQAKALRTQSFGTLLQGGLQAAGTYGQYRTGTTGKG